MPVAVLEAMAGLPGRPDVKHTDLLLQTNPLARWAFDYPPPKGRSVGYSMLHGIFERHDPLLATHVNVELVRQLAELEDNGKRRHPEIGLVGVIDGTTVEAHLPQRKPKDQEHRRAMLGSRLTKAGFLVYTNAEGAVTDACHGFKHMGLIDLKSTLPLLTMLFPANVDERDALGVLLGLLFELWPDCPMEYIVGDALYDMSERLAYDLEFRWGIHPVFRRAERVSATYPHAKTGGVPQCRHGYMKRRDHVDFWTPARRAKHGLARGVLACDRVPRIRWICPVGDPGCEPRTTRPRDNGRIYTYLAQEGPDKTAYIRAALLRRRDSVESVFASTKSLGLAGQDQERFKMIGDRPIEWLLAYGSMLLSARRLAHETGRYAQTLEYAQRLGLLKPASWERPAPGPTPEQLAEVTAERQAVAELSRPPRSLRAGHAFSCSA